MNRHGVCHMWDRNRYDSNSFVCYGKVNVCFYVLFLDFTQIVNKKGDFRKISVSFSPNHSYQYSYCSAKICLKSYC